MTDADTGRYRKIYTRLWRSPEFLGLEPCERLIVLYALSGPQMNRIGYTHFSAAAAAEDLGLTLGVFLRRFATVCTAFGWEFDRRNRVLWVPSWWRFNQPENVNVLKGCLTDLGDVPDSPLFGRFGQRVETLPETFHQTFRERLGKRSPIQEQEQEQDQEQEQELTPRTRRAARALVGLPPVSTNGDGLRERFDAFWNAYPKQAAEDDAWQEWQRLKPSSELTEQILTALRWQRQQTGWLEREGKFVPEPAKYLKKRRWTDRPSTTPHISENMLGLGRAVEGFVKP